MGLLLVHYLKKTRQIEYNSDDDYVDEDDGEEKKPIISAQEREWKSKHCPYLDTIQRSILDFDFEKVWLSNYFSVKLPYKI